MAARLMDFLLELVEIDLEAVMYVLQPALDWA